MPKAKGSKGLDTADNLRRTYEIAHELEQAISEVHTAGHLVVAIAAEGMCHGGPGQAVTMAKMGMAWGALATVARGRRIPIVIARPQEVHVHITGLQKSSKQQVQEALLKRVPRHHCTRCVAPLNDCYAAIGLSRAEHPADALACAVYVLDTDPSVAGEMRRAA